MLPVPLRRRTTCVRKFEVITPSGKVHLFPRPDILLRLCSLLRMHGETLTLVVLLTATVYLAGYLARTLEASGGAVTCAA